MRIEMSRQPSQTWKPLLHGGKLMELRESGQDIVLSKTGALVMEYHSVKKDNSSDIKKMNVYCKQVILLFGITTIMVTMIMQGIGIT